jgi:hypothetical protein
VGSTALQYAKQTDKTVVDAIVKAEVLPPQRAASVPGGRSLMPTRDAQAAKHDTVAQLVSVRSAGAHDAGGAVR